MTNTTTTTTTTDLMTLAATWVDLEKAATGAAFTAESAREQGEPQADAELAEQAFEAGLDDYALAQSCKGRAACERELAAPLLSVLSTLELTVLACAVDDEIPACDRDDHDRAVARGLFSCACSTSSTRPRPARCPTA